MIEKRDLTIATLAKIFGINDPVGLVNCNVNRVLTQSVYVQPGDVVIAAKWYNIDRTINEALLRGAVAVFCDENIANQYNQERVIGVNNPLKCVERFEAFCEKDCDAKRITITGSVGKTTTTGLINSIIAKSFNTLTHHSMSNSHGAILRNFQRLNTEHQYWVQEVGGVQPGYIESSAHVLNPDVVVLTNIGESHLDLYGSRDEILADKISLERYAKKDAIVIINYDDAMLRNANYKHKVITYSIHNPNVDFYGTNIKTTKTGTEFKLICKAGIYWVKLNLFGKYNVYNALAALAVSDWANVSLSKAIESISQYKPSGMRQNMLDIGGYTAFVDCFNAEPKTVLGAAETLSEIDMDHHGRKIFITGHIDKLGEGSAMMHYKLGEQLAKLDIDKMVFFAGDSKYTYQAVIDSGKKNAFLMNSRAELECWIKKNITRDDITFYKSGQFKAALAKSIDHVYGTSFQNGQQFNNGVIETQRNYKFNIRQDDVIEVCGYIGKKKKIRIPKRYKRLKAIRIAQKAFRNNNEIQCVILPDTIVNVGQEAFYLCKNLEKIRLSAGLKYISRSAFNCCKKIEYIDIPEGTLHIGIRAFRDCVELKHITIPSSVGYIGEEAFYNCSNIEILCKEGSYAEQYAIDNKIKYTLI